MRSINSKRGAIELSVGTIVIIVLGVSMLILGMILVRNIMCGALGLTGDVNEKVKSELNKFFGATGKEISCIGAGGEPVKIVPGKENIIYCSIKAPVTAKYSISASSFRGSYSTESEIKSWTLTDTWEGTVSPGDTDPRKVIRLKLPDSVPEETIIIQVQAKKDGNLISTQDLDFDITRIGFFRSNLC